MDTTFFNQKQQINPPSDSNEYLHEELNWAQHSENSINELLGKKLASLELNDDVTALQSQPNCDGSDSGVEIAIIGNPTLQRALSSNSGGYASSLNISCDSSVINFTSELRDPQACVDFVTSSTISAQSECCSENGSESSSVNGKTQINGSAMRRSSSAKKKVAMFENSTCSATRETTGSKVMAQYQNAVRPRLSSLKRTASLPRPTQGSIHAREKPIVPVANRQTTSVFATQLRAQKQVKPDSLQIPLNTPPTSTQRVLQRTPSLSRARTPGTPSDDGRWPSVVTSNRPSVAVRRGLSVTSDIASLKMRSVNNASSCSTLPRRHKQKSVEDLRIRGSRSNSVTRESRMTSSVVLNTRSNFRTPTTDTAAKSSTKMTLRKTQTRIYNEKSVQTALTKDDLEKGFLGSIIATRPIHATEQRDQETQSDLNNREEELLEQIRQLMLREKELTLKLNREREEKSSNTQRVIGMLELARVVGGGRVDSGTTTGSDDDNGQENDSLMMLESQIQISGTELVERQQEISQLRRLCRSLTLEMQRSLEVQDCLLQEKSVIEQESSELQDFLQHEKASMCDALQELETQYQSCTQQLKARDEEVKQLHDECRHLVRLNEQRRQENRMLQAKYAALESKSKELIVQQNYSLLGASTALSGLHTRLDSLVEQLVFSYNLSEHDLEDMGFQTDSHTNNSAHPKDCDNQTRISANGYELPTSLHYQALPPQQNLDDLSPQRNQSFIAAVISAIRHAATPAGRKSSLSNCKRTLANQVNNNSSNSKTNNCSNFSELVASRSGDDSDSTEMLDSETEPCLIMDNVLEDVTLPDSHSHNMVSSCASLLPQSELPAEPVYGTAADSLQNLSQAITNRQQMEMQVTTEQNVMPYQNQQSCDQSNSHCDDTAATSLVEYSAAQNVVDQAIEVDVLVTKLLKVLRLIQMDNDNCIQQLIGDKNKLQQHKEEMLEKLKDLQDEKIKLQDELMDATQELLLKNSDLSSSKTEIQRHRNEIDRLKEDICNLSTLCSNFKKPETSSLEPAQSTLDDTDFIVNLLSMWQAEGRFNDNRIHCVLRGLTDNNASETIKAEVAMSDLVNANERNSTAILDNKFN